MESVRAVLGAMLVWLLASVASAQAVAGSQLAGVIKDSSGRRAPGRVRHHRQNGYRDDPLGDDGCRRDVCVPEPSGRSLPVEGGAGRLQHPGPGRHRPAGQHQPPRSTWTLTVGSIGEQVTVAASSAMLETRWTGVGQVIDNQQVTQIPLNGRQATELIFLSGLATSAPAGDLNTNKNYPTVTISVAGGQANGITYIMDGGTHNDPFNNLNLPTPFPDALQEFKVETSSLPARYGHHAASAR